MGCVLFCNHSVGSPGSQYLYPSAGRHLLQSIHPAWHSDDISTCSQRSASAGMLLIKFTSATLIDAQDGCVVYGFPLPQPIDALHERVIDYVFEAVMIQ